MVKGKKRRADVAPAAKQPGVAPADEVTPPTPLTPRPKLFLALCVALAVWFVVLLVLYFTTVRPYREQQKHLPTGGHATSSVIPAPTNCC